METRISGFAAATLGTVATGSETAAAARTFDGACALQAASASAQAKSRTPSDCRMDRCLKTTQSARSARGCVRRSDDRRSISTGASALIVLTRHARHHAIRERLMRTSILGLRNTTFRARGISTLVCVLTLLAGTANA